MKITLVVFLLLSFFSFGQKLKFKISGQKDTTVFLLRYEGKGLYYADTADVKNQFVEFDGSKQTDGILVVLLPGKKYFEFIYNNEEVQMEAEGPDFVKSMKIIKSEENKIFYKYLNLLAVKREELSANNDTLSKLKRDSENYTLFQQKNGLISKDIIAYQKKVIVENPNLFVSKIIKIGMDIEIPEAPKDMQGKQIDSLFAYHYYRDHYFDNVDFSDDRMVSIPSFHSRLETYFGNTMMVQCWDSIVKYSFLLCDKLDPKSKAFQTCVSWITSSFEQSKIMGMENVFVMMADKYYCSVNKSGKSPAYWVPEDKLKELCETITIRKKLLFGMVPPNVTLRDTSDQKWVDYYHIKADYTVLYFWEPTCGHCKTSTPQLQELYEKKLKARNVEIFSVAKAVGEDFKLWKDFVKDNHLTFITVGITNSLFKAATEDYRQFVPKYTSIESLNYSEHFDVISTPTVFVLDKDKKVVGKKLSISQLEDFLDVLQHQEKSVKIFPLETESIDTNH